jgi:hypothetical protein
MTGNTRAEQRSSEDIRGRVAELADSLQIAGPEIIIDAAPAWSMGAILHPAHHRAVDLSKPASDRRLTPFHAARSYALTIDPEHLASLPAAVQEVTLAYPLVQLAIGVQVRMRKRIRIATWVVFVPAIAVAMASPWPGYLSVAALAVTLAAATIVMLIAVRALTYETDKKVAAMLGADVVMASLDYRRANPPDYRELTWVRRFFLRWRPTPDERASRLA